MTNFTKYSFIFRDMICLIALCISALILKDKEWSIFWMGILYLTQTARTIITELKEK